MFELDVQSRKPIYEQLMDKIKELMINEVLQEHNQLPSVRILAQKLTINPNTIQKAYKQLELDGYIYTLPGKGNFVAPPKTLKNSLKEEKIKSELTKVLAEALYIGIDKNEIYKLVKEISALAKGGES
ncbi:MULTISPECIES: GntR family transcriptional regulator [Peribacillus]|uniref:GntR family transcriptional regulator n=1 Tax=Peribacillus TaxID=2675229 RepID=UPI0006A6DF21|nr:MULTISPECIES: GntR family transcriptional regulator [Peribacillus]KQU11021.1 GntR family transcriptional regulator [Bacillus sp. Leaf13]KRF67912.1 GntR family transcriptional regulator [Bacillus sp. Soil768D1]KON68262.1 GntR family transcriptional regulator [Peribacillus butanolivorans]MBK5445652.1 GntR family transcriptional regulator [Peribacillus sp. TH24]MBK5459631.1 GntR family transcriptional regulator [Peribacillus sp. TH27]